MSQSHHFNSNKKAIISFSKLFLTSSDEMPLLNGGKGRDNGYDDHWHDRFQKHGQWNSDEKDELDSPLFLIHFLQFGQDDGIGGCCSIMKKHTIINGQVGDTLLFLHRPFI